MKLLLIFTIIVFCSDISYSQNEKQVSQSGHRIHLLYGKGDFKPIYENEENDTRYNEALFFFQFENETYSGFEVTLGFIQNIKEISAGYYDNVYYQSSHYQRSGIIYIIPSINNNWKYIGFHIGGMLGGSGGKFEPILGTFFHPMFKLNIGIIDKIYTTLSIYDDALFYSNSIGIYYRFNPFLSKIWIGGFWDENKYGYGCKFEYQLIKKITILTHLLYLPKKENYGFRLGLGYSW